MPPTIATPLPADDAPRRTAPIAAPVREAAAAEHAAYTAFRRQRYFGSLDGLRAISILAVIWHHAVAPFFPAWVPLVHEGNRGVNLFFAISAFLISTLLLRAKEAGTLNVPRFWMRRALRILPLYYGVLLLYVIVVSLTEHDPAARTGFLRHLRYFATFTSNWFVDLGHQRVIFYFAWSLAAEEQFYLCWPWIARWLPRYWPAVAAGAALAVTRWAGYAYEAGGRSSLGLKIIGSVPAAILIGIVLSHVLDSRSGYRWARRMLGWRGSAGCSAVLALVILALDPRFGAASEVVVALALVLLVGTCVVREDNDLAPILRLRVVAWIGTVSYGIYLLHMLAVGAVRAAAARVLHFDSPVAIFVGSVVLSAVLASISYLTYERYFLRLKEKWFAEPSARQAAIPHHAEVVPPAALS